LNFENDGFKISYGSLDKSEFVFVLTFLFLFMMYTCIQRNKYKPVKDMETVCFVVDSDLILYDILMMVTESYIMGELMSTICKVLIQV